MSDNIEKDKLVEEARELKIKSCHVMGMDRLKEEIEKAKAELENPTPKPETEPVVEKEPEVKAPEKKQVVFFWKDKRNLSFSVPTIMGADKRIVKEGSFYMSENSVLRLNVGVDDEAIEILRKHRGNEANGGNAFAEMDSLVPKDKDQGTNLDKLMALEINTLANMVGGAVADFRKSKGQLITEILAQKQ